MEPPSAAEEKLFDRVILVELKSDGKEEPTPRVVYQFPTEAMQTNMKKKPLPIDNITQFCFPDIKSFKIHKGGEEETFSFVLTESSGERRWGYCRRIMPPQSSTWWENFSDSIMRRKDKDKDSTTEEHRGAAVPFPLCFCILSPVPCFSIFAKILDHLMILLPSTQSTPSPTAPPKSYSFEACNVLLSLLYNHPLPAPGETLSLLPAAPFTCTRPSEADSLLDHVNFAPLLTFLSPPTILALFTSILSERRLVFLATRLNTLTSCAHAFLALLYPLSWQHIFIPVLPPSLLSFCCAPMPFVVGVLRPALADILRLFSKGMMEPDTMIFDIDANQFVAHYEGDTTPPLADQDVNLLPAELRELLEKSLEKLKEKCEPVSPHTGTASKPLQLKSEIAYALQTSFIGFMIDLLSGYRSFIIPQTQAVHPRNAGPKFDKKAFIATKPESWSPLLKQVTETQMFDTFVIERSRENTNANGLRGPKEGGPKKTGSKIIPKGNTLGPSTLSALKAEGERLGLGGKPGLMRKERSRFTMYENGSISREELRKHVWDALEEVERKAEAEREKPVTKGGSIQISGPDHSSFRKMMPTHANSMDELVRSKKGQVPEIPKEEFSASAPVIPTSPRSKKLPSTALPPTPANTPAGSPGASQAKSLAKSGGSSLPARPSISPTKPDSGDKKDSTGKKRSTLTRVASLGVVDLMDYLGARNTPNSPEMVISMPDYGSFRHVARAPPVEEMVKRLASGEEVTSIKVIHSGKLEKLCGSMIGKKWRERFFVLMQDLGSGEYVLKHYQSAEEASEKNENAAEPLAVWRLSDIKIVKFSKNDVQGVSRCNVLGVELKDGKEDGEGGKLIYLAHESYKDALDWILVLEEVGCPCTIII